MYLILGCVSINDSSMLTSNPFCSFWPIKFCCWLGPTVGAFFIKNSVFYRYYIAARELLAPIWTVIQCVHFLTNYRTHQCSIIKKSGLQCDFHSAPMPDPGRLCPYLCRNVDQSLRSQRSADMANSAGLRNDNLLRNHDCHHWTVICILC